ncbi:hypothetical protein [Pedobacter mucosus]|uniref:hypothetical protein n=1 Tax=Pedobacter mucosus TaxID=2895286 RepID=UPI001EE4B18B|nr:hypothetical protein [Pedobacter mucosus]UKT63025.1 hypothetical protein LOK61_14760 [Pedobacter mucosus]
MEKVKIHKAGSLPTLKAPEIRFTGEVLISNYCECENPTNSLAPLLLSNLGHIPPGK